jgi:hypothetical protein
MTVLPAVPRTLLPTAFSYGGPGSYGGSGH